MTDLSVVVPTWETRELTLACVSALARALAIGEGVATEILVVDNGSRDGTADAVAERFPSVRVIALRENVGFAGGCNAGLRVAKGRHALLLNSDTEVRPGALGAAVRFLDAHPGVGILGPRLLHPDGSVQSSVHSFPRLVTEFLPRVLLQGLFRRRFPSKRSLGEGPAEVEAVRGAALFARRELIDDIGPLPEDYFFFLEETDWCFRARAAGWRVVHLPGAEVVHLSGGSSKRKSPGLTRIEYHRSLYHFFHQRRGTARMLMVVCLRFAKSLVSVAALAPLALLGGRGRERWRAHRTVLAWHLRGCPARDGLAGAAETAGATR